LEVIDRNQDGCRLREQAERIEECKPDRMGIWRLVSRLGDEEGHLESAAAGRRKRTRDLLDDVGEQLGEAGEGERGLGLDRTTREYAAEAAARLVHRCLPQEGPPETGRTG